MGDVKFKGKVPAPKVKFNRQDALTMEREGWAIFDSGTRGEEIQRDDEISVFDTDEDAVAYVMIQALAGSKTHVKALIVHCQGREALRNEL